MKESKSLRSAEGLSLNSDMHMHERRLFKARGEGRGDGNRKPVSLTIASSHKELEIICVPSKGFFCLSSSSKLTVD